MNIKTKYNINHIVKFRKHPGERNFAATIRYGRIKCLRVLEDDTKYEIDTGSTELIVIPEKDILECYVKQNEKE